MKKWMKIWITTGVTVFAAGMLVIGIFLVLQTEPDYPVSHVDSKSEGNTSSEGEQSQNQSQTLAPGGSILLEEREDDKPLTMTFAGDVLLRDYFYEALKQTGVTGIVDSKVLRQLKDSDLTCVNQEFPIGVTGEPADKTYTFRVEPDATQYMVDMGIDVVTLANNHSLDYGRSALEETFQALEEAGIGYVGAGRNIEEAKASYDVEIKGKNISILGASRVLPYGSWNAGTETLGVLSTYEPQALLEAIEQAEEQSDFTVVYVHWGVEKSTQPEEYQRTLAKQYIDAGADLVLGSHPHVLQGFEYYKGVPIVYSLGNFIFNNRTTDSMMVEATINDNLTCSLRVIPCGMSGVKMTAKGESACEEAYKYLESISYNVEIDENGYLVSVDYPSE